MPRPLLQSWKQFEDIVETLVDRASARQAQGAEAKIVAHVERREDLAALGNERKPARDNLVTAQAADVFAIEMQDAGAVRQCRGQRRHERGLSSAVRAEQGDAFA